MSDLEDELLLSRADKRKRIRSRARRGSRKARLGFALVIVFGSLVGLIAVALAGAAAYIGTLDKLSDVPPVPLGQNSKIYERDCSKKPCVDKLIARIARLENREAVTFDEVNWLMKNATVSIEDKRFWEHGAIDWQGIGRALVENVKAGKVTQGGSSLAQQLAKNLYIAQGQRTSQSLDRKANEAWLAMQLADKFTRKEILIAYLNSVPYGPNAKGVGAAARYFFDTRPGKLTLSQAAFLAGLPQAPSTYDVFSPTHRSLARIRARTRRNEVLKAMYEQHYITNRRYRAAARAPLGIKPGCYGCSNDEYVQQVVEAQLAQSLPARAAKRILGNEGVGGLGIHSTFDPRLQFAARNALRNALPLPTDPTGTLVSIDNKTGNVVAMKTTGNPVSYNILDGRGGGSTFKMIALVATLALGADPDRVQYASSSVRIPPGGNCGSNETWAPKNSDPGEGGFLNLRTATWHSVNVFYAQLISDLTPARYIEMARKLGIKTAHLASVCPIVLGTESVNLLELTNAFSTVADGGVYHPWRVIDSVTDLRGDKEAFPRSFRVRSTRVIPKNIAYEATDILRGVITGGTGTNAQLPDGRPLAGKTGTGEEYKDAVFCGYTPQLTTCVWIGYNTPTTMSGIGGYGHIYGGTIPADIFRNYMSVALKGKPPLDFPAPENLIFKPFETNTSFGYVPPPAAPDKPKKKKKKKVRPGTPTPPLTPIIEPTPPADTVPVTPPPAPTPDPAATTTTP